MGEKDHGSLANLGVVGVGPAVVGGGSSTAEQDDQLWRAPAGNARADVGRWRGEELCRRWRRSGAAERASPRARACSGVFIGWAVARGVGLLRLGGNAEPGKVGTRAAGHRWSWGCRGGVSWRLGCVCVRGGEKGRDSWQVRALLGPLCRGRAMDEVHRRRTAGETEQPRGERWR